MTKHIIKLEDFEAPYIIYHKLAGSYGRSSHKSLVVKINLSNNGLSYEVKNHGEIVEETSIFERAIDIYNELP